MQPRQLEKTTHFLFGRVIAEHVKSRANHIAYKPGQCREGGSQFLSYISNPLRGVEWVPMVCSQRHVGGSSPHQSFLRSRQSWRKSYIRDRIACSSCPWIGVLDCATVYPKNYLKLSRVPLAAPSVSLKERKSARLSTSARAMETQLAYREPRGPMIVNAHTTKRVG